MNTASQTKKKVNEKKMLIIKKRKRHCHCVQSKKATNKQ